MAVVGGVVAIANAMTLINAALATAASAMAAAQKVSDLVGRAQTEGREITTAELMQLLDEGDVIQAALIEKLSNPELPLEG